MGFWRWDIRAGESRSCIICFDLFFSNFFSLFFLFVLLGKFAVMELFSACTVSLFTYFHAKHCLAIHSSPLLLSPRKQQIYIGWQRHFPLIHCNLSQHPTANLGGKRLCIVITRYLFDYFQNENCPVSDSHCEKL